LIGMRQCFLDNGAIDALAAAKVFAKKAGTTSSIDIAMNAGIDDATITALKGGEDEEPLSSIAERHSNATCLMTSIMIMTIIERNTYRVS